MAVGSEDDSEIELKHCTFILIDSVKLSREYLASNPCGLDSPTGSAADRYPKCCQAFHVSY